jgi:hypothetical protein
MNEMIIIGAQRLGGDGQLPQPACRQIGEKREEEIDVTSPPVGRHADRSM